MKHLKIAILTILIFAPLLTNCKKNKTAISNDEKDLTPYASISTTDIWGNVLEDDWNDWQPRMSGNLDPLSTLPAYPNPASGKITLQMNLAEDSHIDIEIYDRPNHPIRILFDGDYQAGFHKLEWDFTNLSTTEFPDGYYRIKIAAFADDGSIYESYGDIQIE